MSECVACHATRDKMSELAHRLKLAHRRDPQLSGFTKQCVCKAVKRHKMSIIDVQSTDRCQDGPFNLFEEFGRRKCHLRHGDSSRRNLSIHNSARMCNQRVVQEEGRESSEGKYSVVRTNGKKHVGDKTSEAGACQLHTCPN